MLHGSMYVVQAIDDGIAWRNALYFRARFVSDRNTFKGVCLFVCLFVRIDGHQSFQVSVKITIAAIT